MSDAGDRILGSLRSADQKGVIRMEDRLRTRIVAQLKPAYVQLATGVR